MTEDQAARNERLYGPRWIYSLGVSLRWAAEHEVARRDAASLPSDMLSRGTHYYCPRCASEHRVANPTGDRP